MRQFLFFRNHFIYRIVVFYSTSALDEAKGWSKEAEESKESAPESAGEKDLEEPQQGGRNVILTLKNDGPLVATVEQLLQG